MTPGQKLRRALAPENVVFAPLTLDALTGRIAEQAGFPAGYISGGALGFAHGVSEALLTLSEIADVTQHVTARSDIAVIVDAAFHAAPRGLIGAVITITGFIPVNALSEVRARNAITATRHNAGVATGIGVFSVAIIAGLVALENPVTTGLQAAIFIAGFERIRRRGITLLNSVAHKTVAASA